MDDRRRLVALISCLVSQSLLLLVLFPSFDSNFNGDQQNLFLLLHEFLSSQELAVSLAILSNSRKRKRIRLSDLTDETDIAGIEGQRVEPDPIRSLDPFKAFFKMKAETFEWLLGLLEPLLECRDPIGSPIGLSPELRLAIGLQRLTTGSDYAEIAGRFGVTEPVARFCAKQLCRVLCTNFRFWVAFPCPIELKTISNSFEELSGLPNCCGVVDCIRFKVVKHDSHMVFDEMSDEDSIAVQLAVDSSSRILSVVAGFRGDMSDSNVLKLSSLFQDINEKRLLNSNPVNVNGIEVNQYMIGKGEYPLLSWLMLPFPDAASGSNEAKFNKAISSMCVPVVKAGASLRNWGVLSRPIRDKFNTAVGLIGACSILHNVLLMREDDSLLCEDVSEYPSHPRSSQSHEGIRFEAGLIEEKANAVRDALAIRASEFCDLQSGDCR